MNLLTSKGVTIFLIKRQRLKAYLGECGVQVSVPPQRQNASLRRINILETNENRLIGMIRRVSTACLQDKSIATFAISYMTGKGPNTPNFSIGRGESKQLVLREMRRKSIDVHIRGLLTSTSQCGFGRGSGKARLWRRSSRRNRIESGRDGR